MHLGDSIVQLVLSDMAALAESLVDEWLNRQGFFTVRGLKHGVDEIDLLGVRQSGT